MSKNLIVKTAIIIEATKSAVWEALLWPQAIKHYRYGAEVETDWREGGNITWRGKFNGKKYEDTGVILNIEPEKTLQYTHSIPLPDKPDNYQIVTIELMVRVDHVEVLLTQDNNADEQACLAAEKNWQLLLKGLKDYVEKS